ncbi:MAG: hypothetical protein K2X50_03935 [Gammaproteobacteria bacterium]|nr:hypothetical protein [Gammaproteobacteria bacterium]
MKSFKSLSLSVSLTAGLALFSITASAQSADAQYIAQSVTSAGNGIVGAINTFAAYVMTILKADLEGKQPNMDQIIEINPYQNTLIATQFYATSPISEKIINDIIGPAINPGMTGAMASDYAGDVLPPTNVRNPSVVQNCGNAMFNFETLLGHSSFSAQNMACNPGNPTDISNYASNYIKYAGDVARQPAMFSINQLVQNHTLTPDQATTLQGSQEWIDFELYRRHLVSVQTAGLSNLYYLYNQRIADSNGNSPEMLSNQIATWRTSSKQWYTDMATALPTVLLREQLFILAEIQRDLHEMRKENQRILASEAILLLRGTALSKSILADKLNGVNSKIQNIVNPSSGTSTSPSASGAQGTVSKAVSGSGYTFPTGSAGSE